MISSAAKGEPAWPPLSLFRAMLLSVWYDLSDVKIAEALDDSASFRRFCGFSASEPTPERTAFVRFRKALVVQGLDKVLFERITQKLKAQAIQVKTGTLVNATIIASASENDDEGHWVRHKGRPAVHGFKAHVGAHAVRLLSRRLPSQRPTTARPAPMRSPTIPARCLQTAPIEAIIPATLCEPKAATPRIVATAIWGRDEAETLVRLDEANQPIHRIRGRIEKIFGTWKRSYGLRRMAMPRACKGHHADPPHCHRLQHGLDPRDGDYRRYRTAPWAFTTARKLPRVALRSPGRQPPPTSCRQARRLADRYGGRVIWGGER
ncbi:transposase [Sinorhizobium medicae]|uniref:transposase n=2 Tax=Sinorhizobium medicae TaxID=110321 RepID=UPI0027DB7C70|nr:transposase [Sinorhizobium medicae]